MGGIGIGGKDGFAACRLRLMVTRALWRGLQSPPQRDHTGNRRRISSEINEIQISSLWPRCDLWLIFHDFQIIFLSEQALNTSFKIT